MTWRTLGPARAASRDRLHRRSPCRGGDDTSAVISDHGLPSSSRAATAWAPKPEKIGIAIAPIRRTPGTRRRPPAPSAGTVRPDRPGRRPDAASHGQAAGLGVQLAIRQPADTPVLSVPDHRRLVAASRPSVAIDAVVRQVDRPADEPAHQAMPAARVQDRVDTAGRTRCRGRRSRRSRTTRYRRSTARPARGSR